MRNTGKKLIGIVAVLSAVFCLSSCEAFFEALTSISSASNESISSGEEISLTSEEERESES